MDRLKERRKEEKEKGRKKKGRRTDGRKEDRKESGPDWTPRWALFWPTGLMFDPLELNTIKSESNHF